MVSNAMEADFEETTRKTLAVRFVCGSGTHTKHFLTKDHQTGHIEKTIYIMYLLYNSHMLLGPC